MHVVFAASNFREQYMVISLRVLNDPRGKVLHLEHVQTMLCEGKQFLPHAFHLTLFGH